ICVRSYKKDCNLAVLVELTPKFCQNGSSDLSCWHFPTKKLHNQTLSHKFAASAADSLLTSYALIHDNNNNNNNTNASERMCTVGRQFA
ncbi:unnamed protein product, partial [Ceratitis capitata]